MFYGSSITSFTGDLPSLTTGTFMFYSCSNLTSFTGDLSSLTTGTDMFLGCKLDLTSVNLIANSLPTLTSGSHPITIGVDSTQVTQAQQDAANATLVSKGWTATWQRN